jgi:DNA-binding response OmpR family regulator
MSAQPAVVRFDRFEVRLAERRLLVDGQPAALGSRAFDLLAALVARRDRVVSKEELIEVVWPGLIVEDNNLQVQISALRKVLGVPSIATVPGRGYQFTVAEAMAPTSAAMVPLPRASERASPSRVARLLVADDNKVNRLLLCRSLELMGHQVANADNGRSALDKLRQQHFDLLLLDLEMPEMDGFALLEHRAADPGLRDTAVIVTSSLEGVAQIARCIELGADDYLHKPVNPVLLRARVDSSLERKLFRDRQRELVARLAPGVPEAGPAPSAQRLEVTLLVARLHGIVALAAQPHDTLELLNNWTTLAIDAVEERGGLVTQIGGDSITAVFGAPRPLTADGGAAWAGVRAATEMIELMALFNTEHHGSPLVVQIGIASGEVLAGYAGSTRRAAYACVGAPMQRAAELEALATGPALRLDAATRAALGSRGSVPT